MNPSPDQQRVDDVLRELQSPGTFHMKAIRLARAKALLDPDHPDALTDAKEVQRLQTYVDDMQVRTRGELRQALVPPAPLPTHFSPATAAHIQESAVPQAPSETSMLDNVVKLREKIDMNHFACQILEHAKRLLGPDIRDKLKDPVQTGVVVDLLLRTDPVFMAVLDAGARPKNVDFHEQITSYLCKPKKNLSGLLRTASTFVRGQVENACVQFGIH